MPEKVGSRQGLKTFCSLHWQVIVHHGTSLYPEVSQGMLKSLIPAPWQWFTQARPFKTDGARIKIEGHAVYCGPTTMSELWHGMSLLGRMGPEDPYKILRAWHTSEVQSHFKKSGLLLTLETSSISATQARRAPSMSMFSRIGRVPERVLVGKPSLTSTDSQN
jgi:hypothetical protein